MLCQLVFLVLAVSNLSLAATKKRTNTLGECPASDSAVVTACVFDPKVHCTANSTTQCASGYRCCNQGCNSVCTAVTVNGKHSGSCKRAKGEPGQTCNKDTECKSYEKCCDRKGKTGGGKCKQVRSLTVPPKQQKSKKTRKQKS